MAIAAHSKAAITNAPVSPANQSTRGIHSGGCETMSLIDGSISIFGAVKLGGALR
jgi:hypothetical protein